MKAEDLLPSSLITTIIDWLFVHQHPEAKKLNNKKPDRLQRDEMHNRSVDCIDSTCLKIMGFDPCK